MTHAGVGAAPVHGPTWAGEYPDRRSREKQRRGARTAQAVTPGGADRGALWPTQTRTGPSEERGAEGLEKWLSWDRVLAADRATIHQRQCRQ
ncbi:hypothetical protein NDU88_003574 [Pleurodeles waltl]|uniref:Uncharacterized protein n=1 Tax=Pleurodeles waltl TaxID=8319 RepID=A0AAV7LHF4_PLEWA|nr:hypothetical protein NDU88_003574 [Pleurodeles waltl]